MKKNLLSVLAGSIGLTLLAVWTASSVAVDVPRMTTAELKGRLGDPDVIIIDVRTSRDWKASEYKIQGAVREDAIDFDNWANKYPKAKTVVLYCA